MWGQNENAGPQPGAGKPISPSHRLAAAQFIAVGVQHQASLILLWDWERDPTESPTKGTASLPAQDSASAHLIQTHPEPNSMQRSREGDWTCDLPQPTQTVPQTEGGSGGGPELGEF